MRSNRPLPPLDLLKGFEAVARHLSFTQAALELHLTQSAVSRQIKQLEDQLGVELFYRKARGLELTPLGGAYFREVQVALQRLRDATAQLLVEDRTRALTVTGSLSFTSLWLVPHLSDFQKKHPAIRVHVVGDNVLRSLETGEFDIAVRYCRAEQAPAGSKLLFTERLVPVCSPSLLAEGSLDDTSALRGVVLLHFDSLDLKGAWLSWNAWFAAIGEKEASGNGALHFSHYEQVVRAALDGHGVALGRVPLVSQLLETGELVTPLSGSDYSILPNEERGYWIVLPNGRAPTEEAQLFVRWLCKRVERTQSINNPTRQSNR